jgi:HSP20 family protein
MHTIIPTLSSARSTATSPVSVVRQPHFESADEPRQLKITVFVPGVEASGIEIVTRGPDLVLRAQKPHPVRINFQALHLEAASQDYELKLRLGLGFNFEQLEAELRDGVLTIRLPKREIVTTRQRRVA